MNNGLAESMQLLVHIFVSVEARTSNHYGQWYRKGGGGGGGAEI